MEVNPFWNDDGSPKHTVNGGHKGVFEPIKMHPEDCPDDLDVVVKIRYVEVEGESFDKIWVDFRAEEKAKRERGEW